MGSVRLNLRVEASTLLPHHHPRDSTSKKRRRKWRRLSSTRSPVRAGTSSEARGSKRKEKGAGWGGKRFLYSGSHSSKDHSPVDSPHSLSPPAPQHVAMRQSLAHLQPSHHIAGSPQKEPTYSVTPLTTMSVPGFPPPMGTFTTAPSQIQDQFSALSHHDLRLAHPSIQQWLQTSPMHHGLVQPPSPIKDEPMSPGARDRIDRDSSHSGGSDYAAL